MGEVIVNDISVLPVFLLFALPLTYLLMLVVGVPAALAALRFGRATLPAALLAGLMLGLLLGAGLTGGPLETVIIYVYFSIVVACALWASFKYFERREMARTA